LKKIARPSVGCDMRITRRAKPLARARCQARPCSAAARSRSSGHGCGRWPRGTLAHDAETGLDRPAASPNRRAAAGGGHDPQLLAQPGSGAGRCDQSRDHVSRRFVAKTTAQLRAWQSAPLDGLNLVALLLDGAHIGAHCLVVALGIAADGQKHALGLWQGATENTTLCQSLLANLQSRGLRTDRSLLVMLDRALALHKAVRAVFGQAALIQRCQVHKLRNILDHLPERQHPWVQAIVSRAY
jgi:hypothetical protein